MLNKIPVSSTKIRSYLKDGKLEKANHYLGWDYKLCGTVVPGKVISIDNNQALIDAGLKSEGRISLEEFKFCDKDKEIKIGDKIDIYVERLEGKNGEPIFKSKTKIHILQT